MANPPFRLIFPQDQIPCSKEFLEAVENAALLALLDTNQITAAQYEACCRKRKLQERSFPKP